MNSNRTGVGEYTYQLLNSIFQIDKTNQYFLFYNSSKDVSKNIPKWEQDNVRYVGLKWPNKLLNLLLFLKVLKLENLVIKKLFENCKLKIENLDVWFSPNLNFISLSKKTKLILTVHDLSFEFMPECFTLKQRLWHWFLRPKKQCQRADIILVPSDNTKRDIVESCRVVSSKVVKVGHGCKLQITNYKLQIKDKYILYLGTLEPRKNVETLILAYKKLHNLQLTTYNLVLAGDKGWKSKLTMKLIKNTPNVRFIGYVDEAKKAGVVAMDVMGPALDMLAHYFHKLPSAEPGLQYKSARDYFTRTEAIEFTVRHDEGLGLETLNQADIILLGVSRTSKTPLSIYLAYQGYRCANVPVMSGIPVPQKLAEVDRRKIVGLTIAEEKLIAFRSTRLKKMGRPASEDYAQKEYVGNELKFAHDLFQTLGVRVVDVTGKSIEEIASEIINDSYFMP